MPRKTTKRKTTVKQQYNTKVGSGKDAGYSKVKGGIKSKKTGRVYKGKGATLAARKRRVMFAKMRAKGTLWKRRRK